MSKDQNDTVNNQSRKMFLAKTNERRRPASHVATVHHGLGPQSVLCCSSAVAKNPDTPIILGCDTSETSQKSVLGSNLKPETSRANMNNETEYGLSREEIVARRKAKVAARKQMKKLEKQQMIENIPVEQVEKPGFTLQLASEDFPTLDALKMKKRININNQEKLLTVVEKVSSENSIYEPKNVKTKERSWKPKVKDPIHIDISQALQNTTERLKPVLKKVVPPIQHNILTGNILDSDNPKRNKGKVRPDKVQKPSKLKSHILIGRSERKKNVSESKENNVVLSESVPSERTGFDDTKLCYATGDGEKYALSFDNTDAEENITIKDRKLLGNSKEELCSVLSSIHSRKFREYCTNCLTEELITSVYALLEKVAYFQDRMYAREPIKASAKRRYVAGINQCSKYLQIKKVKLLVIAPDLERNPGEGGLDEKVQYLKMEAESQSIPCIFGPNRKQLGRAVKKNALISCVAIFSYEGAEEQCAKVLEALNEAKTKYLRLTGFYENDASNNKDQNLNAEDCYTSAAEVTSSLLATLREELPSADRLLNAILHRGSWAE